MAETGGGLPLPSERVDPQRTRFLVIDVQNDFCAEGGWFDEYANDLTLIHEAVDRLVAFIDVARQARVPPIFVRAIYDRIYLSPPMIERHERTGLGIDHCREGTWGAEFFRVQPLEDELVLRSTATARSRTPS
jgi:ureidoacrylate peracid hydrolase